MIFSGTCEWCNTESDDLVEHKDFEEGAAGRLYDVCGNCRAKELASLADEIAEIEAQDGLYDFESEDNNGH